MGAAATIIAQQVGSKATRDALFLSEYDATALPKVMLVSAALSIAGVLGTSRLLTHYGPARVVPIGFVLHAFLFFSEWALWSVAPQIISVVLYLHVGALGSILISGFWSMVNEQFDPHAAKVQIGRIATGAAFGGVLGGICAERVGQLLDVPTMLWVLALLNCVAAAGCFWSRASGTAAVLPSLGRPSPLAPELDRTRRSSLVALSTSPYLKRISLLTGCIALTAALLDYALKAQADADLDTAEELVSVFALFYTVSGVVGFLVQTTLSRSALRWLGLGGTIALLPGFVVAAGIVASSFTRLATVLLVRGVEHVLSNSLFRSGYELLYTPLPANQKRATKTLIDVAFVRLGDGLGSALIWIMLAALPALPVRVVLMLAVAVASVALGVVLYLHRGYVAQLASSLRSGALILDEREIMDATTRRTFAETTMALDRDRLLDEIRQWRAKQGESEFPPEINDTSQPTHPVPAESSLAKPLDSSIPSTAASGEQAQAGALPHWIDALRNLDIEQEPVHLNEDRVADLVTVLGDRTHCRLAARILRAHGNPYAVQLAQALLNPAISTSSRRRLPRILEHSGAPEAIPALVEALSDSRFEVRFRAGRALSRFRAQHEDANLPVQPIVAALDREVLVERNVWENRQLHEDASTSRPAGQSNSDLPEDEPTLLDQVIQKRVDRSLEHVFILLGLVYDQEAIRVAFAALNGDDPNLRGTALEYLENVLPERIRKGLWAHIDGISRIKTVKRPREHIVDDLLRSMESLELDRNALDKGSLNKG